MDGKCCAHRGQNSEGPPAPCLSGDVSADGNVSLNRAEDAFRRFSAHHLLPPDVIKLHNSSCLLLRGCMLIKGLPLAAIYRNIVEKTFFLARSAHSFMSSSIQVLADLLSGISNSSRIGLFGRTHLLLCDLRNWRDVGDNAVRCSDCWRLHVQDLELLATKAEITENELLRARLCQHWFFGLITFFQCLDVFTSGSYQPVYLDSLVPVTSKAEHGKMPPSLTRSGSISAIPFNCPRVLTSRSRNMFAQII